MHASNTDDPTFGALAELYRGEARWADLAALHEHRLPRGAGERRARFEVASLYRAAGDPGRAIAALEPVLHDHPYDARAVDLLAELRAEAPPADAEPPPSSEPPPAAADPWRVRDADAPLGSTIVVAPPSLTLQVAAAVVLAIGAAAVAVQTQRANTRDDALRAAQHEVRAAEHVATLARRRSDGILALAARVQPGGEPPTDACLPARHEPEPAPDATWVAASVGAGTTLAWRDGR